MAEKKPILLIGDVHGKISEYNKILKAFEGKHDCPKMCHAHPNCLGKWGVIEPGIFFVSGADSVDKKWRTDGLDWWADEQLCREDMELALEDYEKAKPDILLCHEAPFELHNLLHAAAVTRSPESEGWGKPRGNSTAFLLSSMLKSHMPKKVVFGHWHVSLKYRWRGCEFICLADLFEGNPIEAVTALLEI